MADFKQIDNARKMLGLNEEASIEDIKRAYRQLSLKYHPDKCKEEDKVKCEETIKEINHAREIIIAYCAEYRYSFREKDVKKNALYSDYDEHLKRFYDGWMTDV
ncbi:MAG: DnaJ domain-containing protein [Candidatus Ancaeobacter aquaticus]|nr:DnaJ domain-containing protein [Candidatus Ancaeobacter aquaticus]